MTNAVKANVIALMNAALALVVAFGVDLSDKQQVALVGLVNAALSLWVVLTYKNSPKRIPD